MAVSWTVSRMGKQFGPFTSEQLRKLAKSGKLERTDKVKRSDGEKWYLAASVRGLFDAPAVAVETPVPVPVAPVPVVLTQATQPAANLEQVQGRSVRVSDKSKVTAGLLALFLGYLGLHNFYLGKTSTAWQQFALGALGLVTCGLSTLFVMFWAFTDALDIFSGRVGDSEGLPLRN